VLVGGGVLIAALVVALLVARASVDRWLTGDGFHCWLTGQATEALQAEIAMGDLRWEGTSSVFAEQFRADGYPEAGFSRLALDGVRAMFGGARDGAFHVPEVTVNRAHVEFSGERRERPDGGLAVESDSTGAGEPGVPQWLLRFLPQRVEVDEVRLSSGSLQVKGDTGETVFALQSVPTRIEPDLAGNTWEIFANGGKIVAPGQPEVTIKDARLRWRGDELFFQDLALGIYEKGHIDGSGDMRFGEDARTSLELVLSGIDIDEVVEGQWRDRLSGTVRGPVRVTSEGGVTSYDGTLHLDDGLIESLPMLERIADYTRSERFERLPLDKAKTDFVKVGETIELRNLAIQSDGLIRVEGSIDVVGDALTGQLFVGVTPGTLRWIPGAERKVFTESRDGFLWASTNLAGTLGQPREDLSARLVAAAGEAILEDLPAGVADQARRLLGGEAPAGEGDEGQPDLTDPSELIKQGEQILNLIGPLLNGR